MFKLIKFVNSIVALALIGFIAIWFLFPSQKLASYLEMYLNKEFGQYLQVSIEDIETYYNGFNLRNVTFIVPWLTDPIKLNSFKIYSDSLNLLREKKVQFKVQLYGGLMEGVTVLEAPFNSHLKIHRINLDSFNRYPWNQYTSSPIIFSGGIKGNWQDYPTGKVFFNIKNQYVNLRSFDDELPANLHLDKVMGSISFNKFRLVPNLYITGDFNGDVSGEIRDYRKSGKGDLRLVVNGELDESFLDSQYLLKKELKKRELLGQNLEIEITGKLASPELNLIRKRSVGFNTDKPNNSIDSPDNSS